DLFLLLVRVAVREPIPGWDALIAQSGLLELEWPGRGAKLQIGCAVELRPDVLEIPFQVLPCERHRPRHYRGEPHPRDRHVRHRQVDGARSTRAARLRGRRHGRGWMDGMVRRR